MKKNILSFFLWAVCSTALAQDVIIDSITGISRSELPFDREFYLPIPHDADETLRYLYVYKKRNGKASSFTCMDEKRAKLVYGENNASLSGDDIIITLNDTVMRKTKNGSLVKIFPLAPSTGYEFRIGMSNFSYSKAKREAIVSAQNLLVSNFTKEKDTTVINDLTSYYLNNEEYDSVIAYSIYKKSMNGTDFNSVIRFTSDIDELLEKERQIFPVDLSSFVNRYQEQLKHLSFSDSNSVYTRLLIEEANENPFLLLNNREHLSNLEEGFLKITDSRLQKPCDSLDYQKRLKNLKETYTVIAGYARIEQFSESGVCIDLNILEQLKSKIDHLSSIQASWEKIIVELATDSLILKSELFTTTTTSGFSGGSTTLDSKGKFIARPDLGLSLATNGTFAQVLPSLGVRFNFRPLDPNLPYRQIMLKGFAHRSSIGVSFTANSITNGSTRFDLLGKTNLVVDYGFRLNNAFNFTMGVLVFKREDPNPFISNQKLAVLPTIGISLDFQIIEAIKDVKDVFTRK